MFEQQLIQNLEFQVEMHEVLRDVLNQECDLKASCSLLELEEIHSVRETVVRRISDLETSRLQTVKKYTQEKDLNEELSLKNILKDCDPGQQLHLAVLGDKLKQLIREIHSIGKQNAKKAIARIACFNEVQQAVHRSLKRHAVYSMYGSLNQPKGACFVQKAI